MELNKENWAEEVTNSEGLVVVDFWAEWCGPCKMLEPVFEKLENEMPEIKFGRLNVDNNQETAAAYGIMSIPTIVVFKNGEAVKKITGLKPKEAFKKEIEEVM